MIVDTHGLLLGSGFTGADAPERDRGEEVLIDTNGLYHRFKKHWADGELSGDDCAQTAKRLGCEVEFVKRNEDMNGFEVLPECWIVDRTFAWLGRYRRLSKGTKPSPTVASP